MFNLTPDQISTLLNAVLVVISVLVPSAAVYITGLKKVKDELVHVLDESTPSNRSLLKLAKSAGKHRAAKELNKLA